MPGVGGFLTSGGTYWGFVSPFGKDAKVLYTNKDMKWFWILFFVWFCGCARLQDWWFDEAQNTHQKQAEPIKETPQTVSDEKIKTDLAAKLFRLFVFELFPLEAKIILQDSLISEEDLRKMVFEAEGILFPALTIHRVVFENKGPQGEVIHVIGLRSDYADWSKKLISQPELSRRFEIKIEETLDSLKSKTILAREAGKNDQALNYLAQWIAHAPTNLQVLGLLGNVYRDLHHYPQAIEVYKKMRAMGQENVFVLHNLGFCYEKMGLLVEASESYRKALEMGGYNELLMKQLAMVYAKNNDTNGALFWINKARAVRDSSDLWLIEGNLYRNLKQYEKAENAYAKVSTLNSEEARGLYNPILVDFDQKQWAQAKVKWNKLKEKDPSLAKELENVKVFGE